MRSGESTLACEPTIWRGRSAYLLANELVTLMHLTGGGHIVDFRFRGRGQSNPFWIPMWKTIEPWEFDPGKHSRTYGAPPVGRVLSGLAGHSLCLDLFGMPSEEEAARGGTLHGEAGVRKWKGSATRRRSQAELHFSVSLPKSQLLFSRSLSLRRGESVVYIRETVKNRRPAEHVFQWQQHAAFGPPFLSNRCTVALPGVRGKTFPPGYEGYELLQSNREFEWPFAPRFDRGLVDLRRVLTTPGRGFVAGVQIAADHPAAFVCISNPLARLAIGYCFRREDFPWVALWEENRARKSSPWKRRERVRGLEFGSSPLPMSRDQNLRLGELFGSPTLARLPENGEKTVGYLLFIAKLPAKGGEVADIRLGDKSIELIGAAKKTLCSLPAASLSEYLC